MVGRGSSGGTTQGVSILLSTSHYTSPRPGQTSRAGEGTVSLCQGMAVRERKDEGPGDWPGSSLRAMSLLCSPQQVS